MDDDRTDPTIRLPSEDEEGEREAARAGARGGKAPEAASSRPPPLPPPPVHPARRKLLGGRPRLGATAAAAKAPAPPSKSSDAPAPPLPRATTRIGSVPPGAVATPIRADDDRATADRQAPPRRSSVPPARGAPSSPPARSATSSLPVRTTTSRPPPLHPGSTPPSRMPKPSDRPPPRTEMSPPGRQRLAQMETMLDQARSAAARQRNEIEELRGRIEEREERLAALMKSLEDAPTQERLEERFRELETRRDALATELRQRFDATMRGAEDSSDRLAALEKKIARLEEGTETARIRMRLERMGHRLDELAAHLGEMAAKQAQLIAAMERSEAREPRVEKLEAFYDDLAAEVREERDRTALDDLLARMDNVETIVLKSSDALEKQLATIDHIRTSVAVATGDDLTRLKGVGPKTARLLADEGVSSFADIAAWTDEDLERVAKAIGMKPSRVRKAGWIATAKELASPPEPPEEA